MWGKPQFTERRQPTIVIFTCISFGLHLVTESACTVAGQLDDDAPLQHLQDGSNLQQRSAQVAPLAVVLMARTEYVQNLSHKSAASRDANHVRPCLMCRGLAYNVMCKWNG